MSRRVLGAIVLGVLLLPAGRSAAPPVARLDSFGDPLPPGAVTRYGTVRLRQPALQSLAFLDGGKRLLTVGMMLGLELRLWDATTGKQLERRVLPMGMQGGEMPSIAPDGGVYLVGGNVVYHMKDLKSPKTKIFEQMDLQSIGSAVSADGKRLAIATMEGGLVLDVPDGKLRLKIDTGAAPGADPVGMPELAFSPDGKRLAQISMTGEVALWDLEAGRKLHAYPKPEAAAGMDGISGTLAFSPDGRFLLTQTNGKMRMLEADAPRERAGFAPPADPLMMTRFSEDGKQLVAIDHEGKLRRYDAATGKDISTTALLRANMGVHGAFFSPDRKTVALLENFKIHLVDLKTGKSTLPDLGDREPLRSLRWSSADKLVSLTQTGRILAWDARTGKPTRTVSPGENEMVLDVDRDVTHALIATPEGPPLLRRLSDSKPLWKADDLMMGGGATFSPDGRYVVTTGEAGIDVRGLRDGKVIRSWKADANGQSSASLSWSADGRSVAMAEAGDDKVTVHEFATGRVRYAVRTPQPIGATFGPKGDQLAVASGDGVIRVFNLGEARPLFEVVVRQGGGGVHPLAFQAKAAIAIDIGRVGGDGLVRCAFSPDGRLLAAACGQDVRVWDMTGKPIGVFQGHEEAVLDLAFAADGRTLATASSDGTALIWDMEYLHQPRSVTVVRSQEETLWADLASDDAERAFRAVTQLRERPATAVRLLSGKLAPTAEVDAKTVRRLIEELEGDTAVTRKQAAAALEALEVRVEAELTKALESTKSAEVRRAVTRLLARIEGPTPSADRLRETRAVEVLESVGGPAAKALLTRLAKGADSRQTREAREALARLAARP